MIPYTTKRSYYDYDTGSIISQEGWFLSAYDNRYDDSLRVENFEFTDTLKYTTYSRGRSSAVLHFVSETRVFEAQMFLSDFDDMMKQGVNPQSVTGRFTFTKKGQNFGLKYLGQA